MKSLISLSSLSFMILFCLPVIFFVTSCEKISGEASTQKKNIQQCSVPLSIITLENGIYDPDTKKGWYFAGDNSRSKNFGFPSARFDEQLITNLDVPIKAKQIRYSLSVSSDTIGASVILDMIWYLADKEVSRTPASVVIDDSRIGRIMGVMVIPANVDHLSLILRPWRDIDGLALPQEGKIIWCQ